MKQIISLVLVFITLASFGQQKTIKVTGRVIDKETNDPLEYATISFISPKENKIITGGITETNGNFSIEVPASIYNVSIEYISFKTITLTKRKLFTNTNLGTISLGLDTES